MILFGSAASSAASAAVTVATTHPNIPPTVFIAMCAAFLFILLVIWIWT